MTRRLSTTVLPALALVLAAAAVVRSQDKAPGPPAIPCESLLAEFRAMEAEVIAMDLALQTRIDRMHAAPDAERIEAIEAVIDEMAGQRKAMRDQLKATHQVLLVHLMRHVESTDQPLASCRLMRTMHRPTPGGSGTTVRGNLDR